MRELTQKEVGFVSGAGKKTAVAAPSNLEQFELEEGGDTGEIPTSPTGRKKAKGNNGFGNGGNDPAPGNSGSTGGGKLEDIVR